MTDEELQERERLANRLNNLVNEYNRLVQVHNRLVEELNYAQSATITTIENAEVLAKRFLPILDETSESVDDVKDALNEVKEAIINVKRSYTIIKNISTATKKLTEYDDEYERKFRLYNKFRKICLGYVIGVDSNIISNESLRLLVEKNYLANSDYWLAHCTMATMLWVSNEKEAALRALNSAVSLDQMRSTIYFLLINLRFGRTDAAKQWYNLYMQNIDVNDIGDEWQYLLQAYLYHAFGYDPEFEKQIDAENRKLLEEVKRFTANYDNVVAKKVMEFADAFPFVTSKSYETLESCCKEYQTIINLMSKAEKNLEIAKYYEEILQDSAEVSTKLTRRIEDVLYNLINAYDIEEYEIIKKIRYNEYIVKSKGDLAQANQMYNQLVQQDQKQTLAELIFKFAFSDLKANIDNSVRVFAISFMLDIIKNGYLSYRDKYKQDEISTVTIEIDGCTITTDEAGAKAGREQISKYYKKNKSKFLRKDKKYKGLSIALIITVVLLALTMGFLIYGAVTGNNPKTTIPFFVIIIVTMVLTIIFAIALVVRKGKLLENLKERQAKSTEKFLKALEELTIWRKDYTSLDTQYVLLQEMLEKFRK